MSDRMTDVLDVLEEMAYQHCIEHDDGTVSSGGISANAYALEILDKHGRFEISHHIGRMVVGRWKDKTNESSQARSDAEVVPKTLAAEEAEIDCQTRSGDGWPQQSDEESLKHALNCALTALKASQQALRVAILDCRNAYNKGSRIRLLAITTREMTPQK